MWPLDEDEIDKVHQKDPVRARTTMTTKLNFKESSISLSRLRGELTMKESDAKPFSPMPFPYLESELFPKSNPKGNLKAKGLWSEEPLLSKSSFSVLSLDWESHKSWPLPGTLTPPDTPLCRGLDILWPITKVAQTSSPMNKWSYRNTKKPTQKPINTTTNVLFHCRRSRLSRSHDAIWLEQKPNLQENPETSRRVSVTPASLYLLGWNHLQNLAQLSECKPTKKKRKYRVKLGGVHLKQWSYETNLALLYSNKLKNKHTNSLIRESKTGE